MIVFLHIPKTAGTSFHFILENNFGVAYCHTNHTKGKVFDRDDFNFTRKCFPRLNALAGHNLIAPLALPFPNPFYMTFLREPMARVLSQYQERFLITRRYGGSGLSFEDALCEDEDLENLQVKLMAGSRNLDKAKQFLQKCHFVGLTEKFDLSLRVLGSLYPAELNLNYQKGRVQADNAIRREIEGNPRLMAMARERNRLDIELYEFAVREIFPKFCACAGLTPEEEVASLASQTHRRKPYVLLSRFYNQSIYRQLCKLRRRFQRTSV